MNQRGFTLLELMVASALAILAITLVFATFLSQQRTFEGVDVTRVALDMERDAFVDVEESLRRAGYGMDPRWAFDFNFYQCGGANCRDKKDGPDELVFYSRNPNYKWLDFGVAGCATVGGCFTGNAWHLTTASTTGLTVSGTFSADVVKGRILEIVCANGADFTMGTVDTATASSVTWNTSTTLGHYNEAVSRSYGSSCLSSTDAAVFLIDRFRYHVGSYPTLTPNYTGSDNYLMLDTGLYDASNTLQDLPIARNVEDMQVSYFINTGSTTAPDAAGPDGGSNWVIGDAPGSVEQPSYDGGGPDYSFAITDAARQTSNAANIRAVRVSLTIRGDSPDKSRESAWKGDQRPQIENRNGNLDAGDRFRRFTATTTIYTQNMLSRSMFIF